jgi:hypothetical protein
MTEVEQLRKEVNELRERLAKLEARSPFVVGPTQPVYVPGLPIAPQWVVPDYFPPAPYSPTITCSGTAAKP